MGVDDCMPQILWTLYFLEAQGYKIDDNVLYQDNKSSILLETNRRGSSGRNTRHIDVRYFVVADQVESGEIRIEHCPTGIMIADYFTKALQGASFLKLQDMIMGNTEIPLPSNITMDTQDPSFEIPNGQTIQESRSVLKDETTMRGSPCAITVMLTMGAQTLKSVTTVLDFKEYADGKKAVDKTLSWADLARG